LALVGAVDLTHTHSLTHSLTEGSSAVLAFIRSFVRSLFVVRSLLRSFVRCSFTASFVRCSFVVRSFTASVVHSFGAVHCYRLLSAAIVCLSVCLSAEASLAHLLTCSLAHLLTCLLAHLLAHLLALLTCSLACSLLLLVVVAGLRCCCVVGDAFMYVQVVVERRVRWLGVCRVSCSCSCSCSLVGLRWDGLVCWPLGRICLGRDSARRRRNRNDTNTCYRHVTRWLADGATVASDCVP